MPTTTSRTERRDALDSIKWAIDAAAYDPHMARELVADSRMPKDPDLHQVLGWAREALSKDRELARSFLRDALRLV